MFKIIKAFLSIYNRFILASRLGKDLDELKRKRDKVIKNMEQYDSKEDMDLVLESINKQIEDLEQQLAKQENPVVEVIDQVGGNYKHYKTSKVLASKTYIGEAQDNKGNWRKVWEDDFRRYTWDQKTPEVEVFNKKTGKHLEACHSDDENKTTGAPVAGRKMIWSTLKQIKRKNK